MKDKHLFVVWKQDNHGVVPNSMKICIGEDVRDSLILELLESNNDTSVIQWEEPKIVR
jgi:hypothetical protein